MMVTAAWALGWAVFVASAGLAVLTIGAAWPVPTTVVAVGGTAGMAYGAYKAAVIRRRDAAAARRQAAAWAIAGAFAFALFAASQAVGAQAPRSAGTLPDFYLRVIRLLVWFGALGGFLSVAAAAKWRLLIGVFIRGSIGAALWAGLVLGAGIAAIFGMYWGGQVMAGVLGPATMAVAGAVSGLLTGALLGSVGEAINGVTHRYSA